MIMQNQKMSFVVRAVLATVLFLITLACGAFCMWIGGVKPFTADAGFLSAVIIFMAAAVAGAVYTHP